MRPRALHLLLPIGLAVVILMGLPAIAAPTFGSIVVVDAFRRGGEPGIDVDSTGYMYENAPSGGGPSWVYRSSDGIDWTSTPAPVAPTGGFDSNGAIDACKTYYMSDLYVGSATVHTTRDGGQTWTSQPISLAQPAGDRQWIEAGPGCDTVYIMWDHLETGIWIAKSTDGALTFPLQKKISSPPQRIGNLAVDKASGRVYVAYAQNGYKMAISGDGGNNWITKTVFSESGVDLSDSFPVVTVDRAGNVYAVWEQASGNFDIYYSYSTDAGTTWSAPKLIQSGSAGSNIFPWAVAGDSGNLDVVWYGSEDEGGPDPNRNAGPWYVYFAQSLNAASTRTFTTVAATPVPIHNDVICTHGTGCGGASRDLLDFFEVALMPNGRAVIAFALDTTNVEAGTGNGPPRNAFIRQIGATTTTPGKGSPKGGSVVSGGPTAGAGGPKPSAQSSSGAAMSKGSSLGGYKDPDRQTAVAGEQKKGLSAKTLINIGGAVLLVGAGIAWYMWHRRRTISAE